MPELPEVETIVRQLEPALVGRTIAAVQVRWPGTVVGSLPAFHSALRGTRIARLWRRGKFFVADLVRGRMRAGHLVGHLRMTGRLLLAPGTADPGPWARVSVGLDDGRVLHFVDTRKFGRLWATERLDAVMAGLGPEPLAKEFTPAWLARALRARRRRLKPLLLDQGFIAGLGNIYVDESLHAARLHPLTLAHTLRASLARRLHLAIRRTLRAAISREGSSFDTFYRTPGGRPGRYQTRLRVYGRAGRPCRTCGTPIVRTLVAQRATHFCPRCQPRTET